MQTQFGKKRTSYCQSLVEGVNQVMMQELADTL